ncbi:hypothetical protein LPB72_13890 [Hydrogenophaga crassostreae]|uniref:DUF2817 domain-containing protein n=1 Tax=Hydrogenophaga crassostreae TaxID=1763535 RepID=A0A162P4N6_9BURK|nr:M14 family metallopeptidase [Hydrogenophaga crassostreae]AOW15345.1 hypothetical protein LPB072_03650 [Hydrogenophaga crassostreae]OAD41302.1 hypothetical protein LPB72_13890 [Hydrogenophaga crassostreae]
MISPQDGFSHSYARARVKFLEATAAAGLAIRSYNHPLPGMEGETLAMDVALDGPANADKLLIVSSACHGAEGFCGSGVQVFAAHDEAWRQHAHEAGVAVLYIHALNPHGFSHLRRVTHENVDINRNFQDFSQPLPLNEAYGAIHGLLLPATWPPSAENEASIQAYIAEHGFTRFQAAVSQGQHDFPEGLFFGGTSPTWSNVTLRRVLQDHAQAASHIAWIDLHTGLGPSGLGERIFACRDDAAAMQRASAWWSAGGSTPVTSIYDGSSQSAFITGMLMNAAYEECPQAEYTGIAMEYGTVPFSGVLQALRGDHWLHLHPDAPPALKARIHQTMRDAFYVNTDEWRAQIVVQARQSMFQAVDGLAQSKLVAAEL